MSFEIDSKLLRATREKRFWSQQDLAQAAGLSERTVQRVEQGEAASLDTVKALAAAFNVNPTALVKLPQPKGLKYGMLFGFGGAGAGFLMALTAILSASFTGQMSFEDAGRYMGLAGLFTGASCALISVIANECRKHVF